MARIVRAGAFVAPALVALLALSLLSSAAAQVFGPPSTVFGSVTDSAGPVAPDLPVEAYIGDKLCGTGKTQYTGEGSARITVYFVDVVSAEQTAGCGVKPLNAPGSEVRIKIGERFAPTTTRWESGPVSMDVTFGDATPAPIPTFTPTSTRTAPPANGSVTPVPSGTTAAGETPAGTIPAGSPGAGSPVPTLRGGISSSQSAANGGGGGDDGGFPIWGVVVLVLGGIAAVGGGVGYAISRNRAGDDSGA